MREACDEAQLHWSAGRSHHDWNRAGGLDRGSDRRREVGDDDIDARADQLRRELRGAIGSFLRVEKLDPDVLTFGVAEALETAAECIGERMRRRCRHQHADARHFSGLLSERSTRRDEQTGRQDTDHIAPSHIASHACGLHNTTPHIRGYRPGVSRISPRIWSDYPYSGDSATARAPL